MSAGAADIRAGRAYVELGTNDSALQKGLNDAKARLANFGSALSTLGSAIAFSSLTNQVTGFVRSFAEGGRELYMLSQTTGAAVGQLDELKKAARASGVEFGDVATGIRRMQRFLTEIARSGNDTNDTLETIGLTMGDLGDLSPVDQLTLIGERIDAIGNAAIRTGTAMSIFGRGGAALIPAFRGLAAAREAARGGGVMSEKDAVLGHSLILAFDALEKSYKSVKKAIGESLAPAFLPVLEIMAKSVASVKNWIKENDGLVQGLGLLVYSSAGVAAALAFTGTAVQFATFAFGGLKVAAMALTSVLGAGFSFVMSPVVLLTAAIVALGVYFVTATETGKSALRSLAASFGEVWSGITDAVKAGDLGLAWDIAIAGIKVAWEDFGNWWVSTFPRLASAFKSFTDWISEHFKAASNVLAYTWIRITDGKEAAQEFLGNQIRADNFIAASPFPSSRAELEALRARAAAQLAAVEAERRGRFRDDEQGLSDFAKTTTGSRGVFNKSAAFGLVGGDGPVVAQLRTLTSIEQEQLRALQRIEEQQAVFQ